MSTSKDQLIQQAHGLWSNGQALDAGRLIFEELPNDSRPAWAAAILQLVLDRSRVDKTLFAQVLHDASHQPLWGDGHRAFSTLRDATLRLENKLFWLTKAQKELADVLALAELVAKVTYNAARPRDEFDEDSGWWIVASLRGFADWWKDDAFSTAAWAAVCRGIQ